MQQILQIWAGLTQRQRMISMGATAVMFAAILGLSNLASKPSMALLYSGLEPAAAGEVVDALQAQGVIHEVRGGAIFVPASTRDQLRMTLASTGLPRNASGGYELLDTLSGFGTTSQMFDATYWRAKEGELARTITASPYVRSARVHIANPSSQPFAREIAATASVAVQAQSGAITSDQAKAFRFLVASAVAGLTPDHVSIIDAQTGAVLSGDEGGYPAQSLREDALRKNVERLLEARVGVGKAIVEVSLETSAETQSIIERQFDPNGRVAISSETQESSNVSQDEGSNSVTVASNLPDGAGAAGRSSSANTSETRERINYEVSETRREIQRAAGEITRVSVAVLVDGIYTLAEDAESPQWEPRTPEELEDLRALVASAIGFDEGRGDIITIKSMEFKPVVAQGTEASSSLFANLSLDLMSIIQLMILSVVTLVLGLFVIRPIFAKATPIALADQSSESSGTLPNAETTNEGATDLIAPDLPDFDSLGGEEPSFDLPALGVVSDFDLGDELGMPTDPVARLKRMIEERHDESVEILRSWMDDTEEAA